MIKKTSMMHHGRRVAPVVSLLLLVSACTAESAETTATSEPTTVTTASATTTTQAATTTVDVSTSTTASAATTTSIDTNSLAEGSGCSPGTEELPDGEWFGFVEGVTDITMSFDLACWFSGVNAAAAAAEDGEESPPPNDYYVRNENPLIREIEVDPLTPVTFYPSGDPNDAVGTIFAEWDELATDRGGFFLGVWVVIKEDEVVEIDEQWVP